MRFLVQNLRFTLVVYRKHAYYHIEHYAVDCFTKFMSCFIIKILSDFHVVGFSQDPKGEVMRENGFFDPGEGQNDPLRGQKLT